MKKMTEGGHLALLTGSLRRQLSLLAVRSQARLLLDMLEGQIGEGAVAAARRRQFAITIDRQLKHERRAFFIGKSQGRNLVRRGFFKFD